VVVFFLIFVEWPQGKEIAAACVTAEGGNAEQAPEQGEIADDGVAGNAFDLDGAAYAAMRE
jgi:hypothetical protein